jgi:hypothetical protein
LVDIEAGIYDSTLSLRMVKDLRYVLDLVPQTFALHQNYPNPFNPLTFIEYDLPSQERVAIRVYDILGREIRTLVDETQEPGYYRVMFDASRISSGVYFYHIEAGSYRSTKKMVLLK